MPAEPCAVCGREFPESELLFGDQGRICAECEMDDRVDATVSRGAWSTILAPPALALTATAMLCLPGLGPWLAGLFGLGALMACIRAIQVFVGLVGDETTAVDPTQRVLILVSGVLILPWALGLVGFGLLSCFGGLWLWLGG